jgi:hypothetical protein
MPPEKVTDGEVAARRGWAISAGVSVVVVAFSIAVSATVNPMLGRSIHWDWMAVVAPTLLILLVVALRRRWV